MLVAPVVLWPDPSAHRARYAIHICGNFLLLGFGCAALGSGGATAIAANALLLAFVVVQIGSFAHDAVHRQIARGRRASEALGLLLWNFGCGISVAWWRDKHLRHHRHPHETGRDPDLYAVFAFTSAAAAGRRGLARAIARYQAAGLIALVTCTAAYFQVLSLLYLLRRRPRQWRLELGLIVLRHGLFFGTAFHALGWPAVLAFAALHYAAAGLYLGTIFATNHYGLPVREAAQAADAEHMFAVTRNVRTGRLGDYLFAGLNYQIEHHLNPRMARYDLRAAAQATRAARGALGLPYHEAAWPDAIAEVLRDFHAVGAGLRNPDNAALPG